MSREPRIGLLKAETPPDRVHRRGSAADRITETVVPLLREKPNTWFRVAEFGARTSAGSCATRLRKVHPTIEWRAVTTRANSGGSVLYARARTRKELPDA